MTKHFTILILTLSLLTFTVACSETQLAQKAAVDVKAATSKAVAAPKTAAAPPPDLASSAKPGAPKAPTAADAKGQKDEDELQPLTVPAGFRYHADGRRDPFVNPVQKDTTPDQPSAPKPLIRPDGLPGVLVSEVRLSGIIRAADIAMTKAILSVGRKTYFARQGDSLFDGVVKEIRPNEVVFMMVSSSTKQPINKEMIVATGKTAALAGEKK
jgi:Tfp pilus assembly protein PilP